jgi:hypothetical protein
MAVGNIRHSCARLAGELATGYVGSGLLSAKLSGTSSICTTLSMSMSYTVRVGISHL